MNNFSGAIYILTNPSFPDYVKIGYSKKNERLNKLNDKRQITNISIAAPSFYTFKVYEEE